jgi:hypothetical protein
LAAEAIEILGACLNLGSSFLFFALEWDVIPAMRDFTDFADVFLPGDVDIDALFGDVDSDAEDRAS